MYSGAPTMNEEPLWEADFVCQYTPSSWTELWSVTELYPGGDLMMLPCQAEQLAMKPWTLNPYPVVRLAQSVNHQAADPISHQNIRTIELLNLLYWERPRRYRGWKNKLLCEREKPSLKSNVKTWSPLTIFSFEMSVLSANMPPFCTDVQAQRHQLLHHPSRSGKSLTNL